MNFLAHVYLSGDNAKIRVGNFIGDFVKGRNLAAQYETEIATGIELHRAIDAFTDSHPVVTTSKNRLRPKYRHYAGVIVDIFYDHFLARQWDRYHTVFLPEYAEHFYQTLEKFEAILPREVKFMMPYLTKGNWLVNYARIEGIHRALTGMARRTTYVSQMEEASVDLQNHYEAFQLEFEQFFPELVTYSQTWLQKRVKKK
jgi:acyl carrier protein phosphodiesterase